MSGWRAGGSSARRDPRRTRRAVLGAVALRCCVAGCARSTPDTASGNSDVDALLRKVAVGAVGSGTRVRVTGIVTDNDIERQLAFIADASRAIAIHTPLGGLGAAPGQRVIVDGRIEASGALVHLSDPKVIASVAGALPAIALVDPASVFDGPLSGRRVELTSRVQAADMVDGHLHLTLTTHGIQLDADVRAVEGTGWSSLLGTDVRFRGVVVPAAALPGAGVRDRIVIASLGDIAALDARSAAPVGPRLRLTT